MKRTSLFLMLALVVFSFGYTTRRATNEILKIYLVDNLLIRTTPGQDIRFFDISNPAEPTQVATIITDGSHDVAVRGNYMFADYQSDLVVYDISTTTAPRAIDTVKNIFNKVWAFEDGQVPIGDFVVEGNGGFSGCNGCQQESVTAPAVMNDASGRESGSGGALSRFAIVGDYLYCLDMSSIKVFDITDPARPRYKNSVEVAWNIETIFHDAEHLFIGGQNGVYIYNITNQGSPEPRGEFTHASSCDPVVVEGNRAYVTLRGGTSCNGFTNQLDILDISDLSNPKLLKSYKLTGPYGLTVENQRVIVCDGAAGLKILDTRNVNDIKQIGALTDIVSFDVILRDNLLVVTADDGYYLYDASDISSPRKFSRIP